MLLSNPPPNIVKERRQTIVGILDMLKEVYNVVGLPEVILNVVILRRDSEFDKLILECATLLEKAMHFTCYLHSYLLPSL